ncbi:MAG: hypothetical protein M3R65_02060 [Gemmatimonadota bacterium]|nr:hypothetical protein [Gemmatimonadota bacterium]
MRRGTREVTSHLIDVFLVTLLYLVAKERFQRAVTQALGVARWMIRNYVGYECSREALRPECRVAGEEGIDRPALSRLGMRRLNMRWLNMRRLDMRWLDMRWLNVRWLDMRRLNVRRLNVRRLDMRWLGMRWLRFVAFLGIGASFFDYRRRLGRVFRLARARGGAGCGSAGARGRVVRWYVDDCRANGAASAHAGRGNLCRIELEFSLAG